jgi:hypothetical protein
MSKTSPDVPREPKSTPDAELSPRERVRRRVREMAPLAWLAATPLVNTACDPPPPPPLCEYSPSDWLAYDYGGTVQAAWGEDNGERIVLLDAVGTDVPGPEPRLPATYSIAGGSLLPSTSAAPYRLRIRPDAGAQVITLEGTMSCQDRKARIRSAPVRITIDLEPPDGGPANAAPVAKLALR